MFEILKLFHILALMLGAAASFGNLFMMMAKGPHDLPSPGFTSQLRFLFRISALLAIIVFWVSGILMVFAKYGWWVDSFSFDVKIVFATIVLLIVLFLNLLAMRAPKGAGGPPSYVRALHVIGSVSLILAAAFAVFAFG